MTPQDTKPETSSDGRIGGGLMLGSTLTALFLMMHHPTSLNGPDYGHLMTDWSNGLVHGGMIATLLVLIAGTSELSRRLGEGHLSVRAGAMAFRGGIAAMIGAALINGFVVPRIVLAASNDQIAQLQGLPFGALNQVLALFGMVLVRMACALWAVRLLRLGTVAKIAAVLGIMLAALSCWWLVHGQGAFGLYPAMIALTVFAVWSLIVAVQMLRGQI